MGEPLYEEVVGEDKLRRPCRIYAPVGSHETLLAYLVRRLLENGANTSFVNRIADPDVPIDDLIADPVTLARAISPLGAPHPKIAVAAANSSARERRNSAGLDLTSERQLAALAAGLPPAQQDQLSGGAAGRAPRSGERARVPASAARCCNPADRRDVVGLVVESRPGDVDAACAQALAALAAMVGHRARPSAPRRCGAPRSCSKRARRRCSA